MTRDELLNFHMKVCEDARALMNLKNRDYAGGGGEEPFANFTRCEAMGIRKAIQARRQKSKKED